MAYEPEFIEWWEKMGRKLGGENNKASHYYAYKEGAFNEAIRSFREWAESKENE
jgi:hypothetical protein